MTALPVGSIQASHLGKAFRRYPRQRARLLEWLTGGRYCAHSLHQALEDINFQIQPGEAVAVIGQNGAGKSTLLKMIAQTLTPTHGRIDSSGRICALLELGLGFDPEFSGRQNLSLAGQMVGLSVSEVAELTPWVENFADIGDYIDQPVRTYSSGMQMRLAFAIAVCKRPDILIVDEALSVGDIFFQQKCFDLLRTYHEQGSTLLFVTHGMSTAQHLCERALLIDHGRLLFDGSTSAAIDLYEAKRLQEQERDPGALHLTVSTDQTQAIGSLAAAHVSVTTHWETQAGEQVLKAHTGDVMRLVCQVKVTQNLRDPHVGFKLRDWRGLVLYESNSYCHNQFFGELQPGETLEVVFEMALPFAMGEYNVTIGVADGGYGEGLFEQQLYYVHGLSPIRLLATSHANTWTGLVDLRPRLQGRILTS